MCHPPGILVNAIGRTARRSGPATFVGCVNLESLQTPQYARRFSVERMTLIGLEP